MALTLIKQHQAFILEATNFPDICDKFKQITKGTLVTECHSFMQVNSLQLLVVTNKLKTRLTLNEFCLVKKMDTVQRNVSVGIAERMKNVFI